jgi:XTP/dITP diphosphohydrolase
MILYACSSNRGKLEEFALAGRESGIHIQPLPGLAEIAPPEETGNTFEENAVAKARYYSGFTSELVFADDSGLVVPALNGAPGLYSSRYAGVHAGNAENNALLLKNMQGIENRTASFVCVAALACAGEVLTTSRGTVDGRILANLSGTGGFGYDPLFFYPPFDASFGNLDERTKFSVSHRGNALRELFRWLRHSGLTPSQKAASPLH